MSFKWKPVKDFNLSAHSHLVHPHSSQERILQVAFTRDCEQERDCCEGMCMAGLRGRNWSHMRGAKDFFEKLLKTPEDDGEQVPIQLILDVLGFISATRQLDALGDFIEHVEAKAPPFLIASFETQEQAQDWLANHPNPPAFAAVLVGGRYHDVVYERETDFRRLPWNRDLERYFSWLKRVAPPIAAAFFATRPEAEAWLAALHPLSLAESDEQETESS